MSELKLVTLDNAHLGIPNYITENNLKNWNIWKYDGCCFIYDPW